MAGNDLARHHQGLDVLCKSINKCESGDRHHESESCVSSPGHIVAASRLVHMNGEDVHERRYDKQNE
jgi:hypothetical protein